MPCRTITQSPFGAAGRIHQARSFAPSMADSSTSFAFRGVAPTVLGTCRVTAQKTPPAAKKQDAPAKVTAVANAIFFERIKCSSYLDCGRCTQLAKKYLVK